MMRSAENNPRRAGTIWMLDLDEPVQAVHSYGWVNFVEEHTGELNLRIQLLPGEGYLWDCATIPAFRRSRL